jgi:hypothetical protein
MTISIPRLTLCRLSWILVLSREKRYHFSASFQNALAGSPSPKDQLSSMFFAIFELSQSLTICRRHMDRHDRPFTCLEQSCNNRTFPDKGTLQRHQHSVHSKPHIHCPVKSCRRHTKGFARKDNLREHINRAHPKELLQLNRNYPNHHFPSIPVVAIESETFRCAVQDGETRDGFAEDTAKAAMNSSSEAQILERKLQELKTERASRLKSLNLESLDKDIMAVERTLKLVKPTLT